MLNALALNTPLSIRVYLPGRVLEFNLAEELTIDVNNIKGELGKQPAKYAMVATLADLSSKKLDNATRNLSCTGDGCSTAMENYHAALKQHRLLVHAREAFLHRRTALLGLWADPHDDKVMQEYRQNLSNLGALKDNVP